MLLAGQGSKVPSVMQIVRVVTDAPIVSAYQNDAVSRGLAKQAAIITGQVRTTLLIDSLHRGLAVRLVWLDGDDERPPPRLEQRSRDLGDPEAAHQPEPAR